jgi:hypothetical protein
MSIVVVGTIGYDSVETQFGSVVDVLGGSAAYFALAASFFAPVSLVAAVGSDFKPEHHRMLAERNVDLRGLKTAKGKTFRWRGRYHEDMNKRDTLELSLNVFADFVPDLLPDQRRADYLFLANIAPELQESVLKQIASPKVVAADTMNHWIDSARDPLVQSEWPRYVVGAPDEVHGRLTAIAEQLQLDELMAITVVHSHQARMRSYELLAQCFELAPRAQD